MTASDWRKLLKQILHKPAKKMRFIKHNKPKDRTTGIARKRCERCGRIGALVSRHQINLCRQCFREIAEEIGFKKYN